MKIVNDTHGHQAGDTLLRHVADAMRRELRSTDTAARIGGDEFAIILPEAGGGEADATARRLIVALHATDPIGHPRASISAGVAILDGCLSPGDVMKHADVALYEAKRAGAIAMRQRPRDRANPRGRVTVAPREHLTEDAC